MKLNEVRAFDSTPLRLLVSRRVMDPLTGAVVPPSALAEALQSGNEGSREHALACLSRAAAAGLDVSSVLGAFPLCRAITRG